MADLPVACTLGPAALKARREGHLKHLLAQSENRHEMPEGYRLRFTATDEILPTIARTVDAERQCCRFLRFQVTVEPDGGPIWLDMTGPVGTGEFLAAMFES